GEDGCGNPSKIQGLLEAVADWLPHAEQKKCTRHVYAKL
nr:transposase, MuDR, plant [Tanacetum cinerariifolium]